ncbi:MAG: hypothetical protein K6U89_03370 [Chloroflexi bacterium]|nr:hypothetical protein [Chloroflexota bacterium]
MPVRHRACPRCQGDLHLLPERPPLWACLQCGVRLPLAGAFSPRSWWEQMRQELRERAEL